MARPVKNKIDIGDVFGRLTVHKHIGKRFFECICICGALTVVFGSSLWSGDTRSCGCLRDENITRLNLSHGHLRHHSMTPEYRSYAAAKSRCNNPNNNKYPSYGGRGIKFLFESFEHFYAELGPRPEPKYLFSIDRLDSSGHYEPGNVRWATAGEQARNRGNLDSAVGEHSL